MSVFSKLFPGSGSKSDTEAASATTTKAEEGPSMQRPPHDGRGAPQQPNPPTQKAAAPATANRQSTQKAPVAAAPATQGSKNAPAQVAAVRPAAGTPPPASATSPQAGATPPVVVSRSIDVGPNGPARSRPAMPDISIGPPGAAAVPSPAPATAARRESAPDATEARTSVRPTAPAMTATNGNQASIADTFERLLSSEDLEAGFAHIERAAGSATTSHNAAMTDLAEVRVLFAQLAANHVRQVRDFMIDLRWSEPTTDWVPICEPALRSLRRAADKLELTDLCGALDRFAEALAAITASGQKTIVGPVRDTLLARYDDLAALMPQAFALDLDRTQREAAILQSLLLQVPEVKKVTLDRMYAAGLTTLEAMFLATPGDIAATTGIPEPLAARVVARFQAYRDQVKATVPDATRARERERIAELTARLKREHDEYERLGEAWSRSANDQRKELRKAREQTLLDIQVTLARLGEVERLTQLERLPFEKKLAHLESFLEEARDKYVAQP